MANSRPDDLPHVQLINSQREQSVQRQSWGWLTNSPSDCRALQSLLGLCRRLASMGIITERTEQRFALTDLGEALKTGAPGSAKSSPLASAELGLWKP